MRANMLNSETIGYVAAILTTASFIPQAWHTLRTRDVQGISLAMYSVLLIGCSLWLAYGLMASAWPVVLANAVTISLVGAILVMKLRFQRQA
jgi:MtN3 and saliva related transmembrane protein